MKNLAHIERVERIIRNGTKKGLGAGEYIQLAVLSDGREVPFCARIMDDCIYDGMLVVMFEDNIEVPKEIFERVNIIEAGCMKGNVLGQGGVLPLELFPEVTDNIIFDEAAGKDVLLVHAKDERGRVTVAGGEVVGADCTDILGVKPANTHNWKGEQTP